MPASGACRLCAWLMGFFGRLEGYPRLRLHGATYGCAITCVASSEAIAARAVLRASCEKTPSHRSARA
jgi:hypothetical protein